MLCVDTPTKSRIRLGHDEMIEAQSRSVACVIAVEDDPPCKASNRSAVTTNNGWASASKPL